jgi:trigger factor
MQVTETISEGLKRELKVVVNASELHGLMEERLGELKDKVQLKGFRPGKVPMDHIRKTYGRSVMAEVVEQTVSKSTTDALKERNERPAFQPEVKLPEDKETIENVLAGNADLEITMKFEVLPKIELADLREMTLEKPVADVEESEIDRSLENLRKASIKYVAKDGAAENGDQVTMDFTGYVDGEAFEGGSAEDAPLVLGQGRFIPGFEDGLIGVKAGDTPVVNVTFPEKYPVETLAGKPAEFKVTVKEVAAPVIPEADDEFATSVGMESLEKLRAAIKERIAAEYENASRMKLKKALLDALDTAHSFDLPPSLVEHEFNAMWEEVTQRMERTSKTWDDEKTTEEKVRGEYQGLAERRVRLGLVLSEIGQRNEIKITDEDLRRAILDRARSYPGQENMVIQFYKKNPDAVNELRAPVYEEKVVTFALELTKVTGKTVPAEELLKADEEDGNDHECGPDCDHDHDHGH